MKKKLKTGTKILIIVCFVGLSALLYPSVANFYNENFATKIVSEYIHTVQGISDEEYQKYWEEAIEYNRQLFLSEDPLGYYQKHQDEYMNSLDPNHTSIFGYVEIPKIGVYLPLFHTTSTEVLATAIGHLEWTSLPTGGIGTHCCISGHRGLASAKLFTNLDMLREGDTFVLNIMNETLTYEVDQIRTVLPHETSYLNIDPDNDYCTMITCTPYGINTHRLLVRGHRIENSDTYVQLISEAVEINDLIVALFLSIPILFLLLLAVMLKKPEKKKDILQQISEMAKEE